MRWLKVTAAIVSIAIASLAYVLLTRYFPGEAVSFMGPKPLMRALLVDIKVKSNRDFPTFLPENSGFLVIHPSQSPDDHREDIIETRDIFSWVAKTNKDTFQPGDALYPELEILFLKSTLVGLRARYVALASLGIKSVNFSPDYLAQFSELYLDKLSHAAGYTVMADGSQRLMHDMLVTIQ